MSNADSGILVRAGAWIAAIRRLISRTPRRRLAVVAFLLLVNIYLSNDRVIGQIDSVPSSLLPVALLVDGTLTFDKFAEALGGGDQPNGFRRTNHGLVSWYPIATGILAVPFYGPVVAVKALVASPSRQDWVQFAMQFQKLPAAVFAALAVLVFWGLCEVAEFSTELSVALTLWFAFGSELFSIGSQTLWQHGPGTLAVVAGLSAQLRLLRRPSVKAALALSAFCAVAVAIRLPNILIAGPIGLIGLLQARRLWLPLVVPALIVLGLLVAYNLHFFGGLLGNYDWAPRQIATGTWWAGLPGLLWSPGRGLFIYFAVSLIALLALALRPRTLMNPSALSAGLGAVAALLFYAGYDTWWGGWCYGPRYLSEIEPIILLLLGLACCRMRVQLRRGFCIAVFALLPYGVLVQAVGVYSDAATTWSYRPSDVDYAPRRLWDIADNPIFRGLGVSHPVGAIGSP
jgi:hypothetical protein